jgi:Family of unknown function (DUF5320)
MPFGDRTGPQGLGPRTGRGAGYSAGFRMSGSMDVPKGAGFGFGRGRSMGCQWCGGGRGWRNWYIASGLSHCRRAGYGYSCAPSSTAKDETKFLTEEAELLRKQLEGIQKRISILEKAEAQES